MNPGTNFDISVVIPPGILVDLVRIQIRRGSYNS